MSVSQKIMGLIVKGPMTLGELAEARRLGMPIYENLHELAAAVAVATINTTTGD
jgi:NAD-dependent oxidoreductase involved in siderophore biosynthesis